MAKEHILGVSWWEDSEDKVTTEKIKLELDNKAWAIYLEKKDFAGLVITNARHFKRCIRGFHRSREDQIDQEKLEEHDQQRLAKNQSQRWQLLTDKNGVRVWSNASS